MAGLFMEAFLWLRELYLFTTFQMECLTTNEVVTDNVHYYFIFEL
jgi:hypothetical protein